MMMEQVFHGKMLLNSIAIVTTSWWTKFNSDDIIIDYQYTNQITNDLNVVAGYNYDAKTQILTERIITMRGS